MGDTSQVRTLLRDVVITYAEIGASMTGQGLPVTIDSSEIGYSETFGIHATRSGTARQIVSNSRIHDNGTYGVRISASGSGCTSRSTGITLTGNEIDHNNDSGIYMTASGSSSCLIGGGSGTVQPIITGNRIHSNLHGITGNAFAGSRSGFLQPQIQNNFIYDNLQDGMSLVTNGSASTISPVVVSNTVVRNGRDGIFQTTPAGPNMRLFNNLVVGNSRGITTNAGAVLTAGTIGFNNVFSNSGGNWSNFPTGVGTPTIVNANGTPADDYFNVSVDAGFAADNLHLRTDSLLVGAGTADIGASLPALDFDGDARQTPPDIGADEVPKLTLSFAPTGSLLDTSSGVSEFYQIRESTSAGTVTGTVRRTVADLSGPLTVSIANPDPTALALPASVTIPAGDATASFPISTVDDGNVESDTDVSISLSAPATAGTIGTIRVVDDERLPATPVNAAEHRINLVDTTNIQADAAVAWLSDTQYVAVWKSEISTHQSHTIRARIFDITDQPVGDEILVATVPNVSGEQRPQVGVDASGNFVVAWSRIELIASVPNRSVMSRRFAADGTPLTNEVTLATGAGVSPGLNSLAVARDGRWSLLFKDYSISTPTVFVQRFSPGGVPEGSIESLPFSIITDSSSIAYDPQGNLISVGVASTGILGRKYTASTGTWSQVFTVSPTPIGAGSYFSPTADSADDGTFVVSWIQRNLPTFSVLAKRMNADGSPSTEDLIVTSGSSISLGRSPSVASSSNGNFSVTWALLSSGAVMVRQYHRDGLPVNDAQQINTASGSNAFPRIALSPNEEHLVAIWQGNGPGDTSGVFARQMEFPQPALQLLLGETEVTEGSVVNATITRSDVNMTGALTVSWTSDKPTQINLPESVTIPAGQASATFQFTAIDETVVDGTQVVKISTNANGFENSAAEVTVFDNDARLSVSVSVNSIAENAGTNAAIVTVHRNSNTLQPLIVSLSTDGSDEIAIPASVIIPVGAEAIQFFIDAVDDFMVDGDQLAIITAAAPWHTSGNDMVIVTDDDVAGFSVTETNGTTEVVEGGATDAIELRLMAQPLTNVVLHVIVAAENEVTFDRQTVTFTPANWNHSQTVTLAAVDDWLLEETKMVDLTFRINAVATDPAFSQVADQKVVVKITDNDVAGFTIFETGGTTSVAEPDTQDSFVVVLTAQPLTDVVLTLVNPDPGEVQLDAEELTFSPTNWHLPQTVVVTAVNDDLVDGLQTTNIRVSVNAMSSDDKFGAVPPTSVLIQTVDDDTRGIAVSAISGNTTEAGGTATFTVVLNSEPTANVTIPLSSSDTTEGTVSPASLTFTPANWNVAQTVTVTGVDDSIDDGDIAFNIVTGAVTGGDYDGIDADDVAVTNEDDDEPLDFGDAPGPYPVTLAQDGARHTTGALFLGTGVDVEADGQPSTLADADIDDGVMLVASLFKVDGAVTKSSFRVVASQAAKLDAWIDFNNDGDWSDTGEKIFNSVNVVAGVNLLSFTIPAGTTSGSTGARFRLSTAGNLAPTGAAADGEVEDYLAVIVAGSSTAALRIDAPGGNTNVVVEGENLVVRQGTTIISQVPFASFGELNLNGSSLDDTLQLTILEALATMQLVIDGGLGRDFLELVEAGQTLDLTDANVTIREIEGIDIRGTGNNTLVISIDSVKAASSTTDTLEVLSNAGDTINFGPGWRADLPRFIDGQFTHMISETAAGGTASVEVRNDRFFTNPLNRFDVDRSGSIQPLDALRIINAIRRLGSGPIVLPSNDDEVSNLYFDVSGDNNLTALDALRVINAISRINRGVEPEGESALVDLGAFGKDTTDQRDVIDMAISEFETPAFATSFGSVQHLQRSIKSIDDWMEELGNDEFADDVELTSGLAEKMPAAT